LFGVHAFRISHGELAVVFADITERRKAEETLAERARQMTAILNNIPDIAWLKDEQSRFIAVNEPFGAACGVAPGDLVGRSDLGIWPEDLADGYLADDVEVMRTGQRKRVEERLVASDGQESWLETIKTPIFNDRGDVIGTTGIARDITERKHAEAALRESEARFRDFAETAADWFWEMDAQLRFTAFSGRFREAFGQPADEAIGRTRREMFDQSNNDPKGWDEHYRDLIAHRPFKDFEYVIVREDGAARVVHTSGRPVFDDDGVFQGYRGVGRDVTERKQAEEALFAEKERAQVTLHSIGDGVITTDFGGRVEYLNPVAEALTGWDTREAEGRFLSTVFRVVDERTHDPVADPVARCLQEGRVLGLANHSVLVRRDDHQFDIEYSAAPISGQDNRVFGVVLVFHDVTERRLMIRQMAHDAAHDALTGLVNRREFERRLERALADAKEHAVEHALCYLDLDQFKIINDTAGHAAGDELLKRVSHLLADSFRERDTLARLGGDEFGLLLEHCPLGRALLVARSAVDALRDHRFVWKGRTFQVGASVGIVSITAQCESLSQLFSQADVACYTAKEHGRDRIHVYEHAGSEPAQRHSELLRVSGLRDALEQNRFSLCRQPIEPLVPGKAEPRRYELLLRLLDEQGNAVLPNDFIPAAERYGLMARIDRWVIRTALARYHDWFGESGASISINLSGNSLSENGFGAYVEEQLALSAVAPERLCFEVTETAVVHNLSQAMTFITAVRKQGVELALDDFGSGLSSFRYLKTLPVDYLKIDGAFVQDMMGDERNHAMVRAIHDVGRAMGIKTIAEYACSPEIVAGLKTMGVDYAQGYAIGAPQPCQP
jgi:diguanylate cyclase (GGDEF)-like protein/PAS domain S-box-containing protein